MWKLNLLKILPHVICDFCLLNGSICLFLVICDSRFSTMEENLEVVETVMKEAIYLVRNTYFPLKFCEKMVWHCVIPEVLKSKGFRFACMCFFFSKNSWWSLKSWTFFIDLRKFQMPLQLSFKIWFIAFYKLKRSLLYWTQWEVLDASEKSLMIKANLFVLMIKAWNIFVFSLLRACRFITVFP